jgi:hypothetical protein
MNSSMSKGFWTGNRSKRSSFNSTIDYLRYTKQNKRKTLSKDLSVFQQRRAKQNLERDLNWNGPHDEEFFRCFEQYLGQAIVKMVAQKKKREMNNQPFSSKKDSDNKLYDDNFTTRSPIGL